MKEGGPYVVDWSCKPNKREETNFDGAFLIHST